MKKIGKIIIYRAYDVLFMGYYEYSISEYCKQNQIQLEIKSPRFANITYSPRSVGIRGQMYIELFDQDSKLQKKIFLDISDGFDDIRLEIVKQVDVYFKCNCNLNYLNSLDLPSEVLSKIKPSSLFFPINFFENHFQLYKYYISSLFELVGFDNDSNIRSDFKRWGVHFVRAKNLFTRPKLDFYKKNYNYKNENFIYDVFYSGSTWFGVNNNLFHERAGVIKAIRQMVNYKINAEFIYNRQAKEIYPDLMGSFKLPLKDYFENIINSKVIVINKSLSGGAISWRVGECYALGKVFIHEDTPNNLYEDLFLDPFYGKFSDTEDLVYKLTAILTNAELYKKMLRELHLKYITYFDLIPTAKYILDKNIDEK